MSAPCAKSCTTTSRWPSTAACISAVTPSELRRFTLAPASRTNVTIAVEPLDAAAISAVIADLSGCSASTSVVIAKRSETICSSPAAAATTSGEMAADSAMTVQSAPALMSAVTTSTAPTSAAMWHAVTPRVSFAFASAPAASRVSISSGLFWPQPAISAVSPSYRA
eukprot:3064032-Prymnesium_polylepis.1